jgi:hypothetical protein
MKDKQVKLDDIEDTLVEWGNVVQGRGKWRGCG